MTRATWPFPAEAWPGGWLGNPALEGSGDAGAKAGGGARKWKGPGAASDQGPMSLCRGEGDLSGVKSPSDQTPQQPWNLGESGLPQPWWALMVGLEGES